MFDINVKKFDRFKFPRHDPEKNSSWFNDERSKEQILVDIINLSLDRLKPHEYNFWTCLSNRDVLFKEIYDNGMPKLASDIRKELSNFKRNSEKQIYVESKKQKIQVKSNKCQNPINLQKEQDKCKKLTCECCISRIDMVQVNDFDTEMKLMMKNNDLFDFIKQKSNLIKVIDYCLKLKKLSLKQSKKLVLYKNLIAKEYVINSHNFKYLLKILFKSLKYYGKAVEVKTIKIPPNPVNGLPYVTGHIQASQCKPILERSMLEPVPAVALLVDSGADQSVLSESHLRDLGISKRKIENTQKYNIRSSTETSKDAISGAITLDVYLANNDGSFGVLRKCQFLVVRKHIKLDDIILGGEFLKRTKTTLSFSSSKCRIRMEMENKQGNLMKMDLVVLGQSLETKISLVNKTTILANQNQEIKFIMPGSYDHQLKGQLTSKDVILKQSNVILNLNQNSHFCTIKNESWPVKAIQEPTFAISLASPKFFEPGEALVEFEYEAARGQALDISSTQASQLSLEASVQQPRQKIQPSKEGKNSQSLESFLDKPECWQEDVGNSSLEQEQHIKALKTKIIENIHDEDIISLKKQEDISSMISEKIDNLNIIPTDPGETMDLSHIETKLAHELKLLIDEYHEAFAKHKYDIGKFEGFTAQISVREGSSAFQRPRKMKNQDVTNIQNTMDSLIKAGVFSKANDGMQTWAANINLVDKPEPHIFSFGKADKEINKAKGILGNKARATIDFRNLNDCLIEDPRIELPSLEDLQNKVRNCFCSSFDLNQMFFGIALSEESKKYTNFWYNGELYRHEVLAMGLKLSPYVGQKAVLWTFSDSVLKDFLNTKGWSINSTEFPFSSWSQCLIFYQDDLAAFSSKNFENAETVHKNLIEAIFWALRRAGWKLSKKKSVLIAKKFKFLGVEFSTEENYSTMVEKRIQGISEWRSPRSIPETLSRLAVTTYFSSYIPLLKKITSPLHKMCLSENFNWGQLEAEAWGNLKFVCGLKIKNYLIDKSRPLFLTTDASQISIAWMLFQINKDGDIEIVATDSKLLHQADRNKAASFRELLALMSAIVKNELRIRDHPLEVVILSDCISLQFLHRTKYNNSRLLEFSLYLSTFSNISVHYCFGKSLYFADALSRSYNEVHLENSSTLSKEWAQFIPALKDIKNGTRISPKKLVDWIVSEPRSETLDCFAKSNFYSQNLNRYHVLENHQQNIPAELEFLAKLYTGWGDKNLTQTDLNEIEKSIRNLPVESLSRKIKDVNLNKLRKKLASLNLHSEFIKILSKKYGIQSSTQNEVSGPPGSQFDRGQNEELKIKSLHTENECILQSISDLSLECILDRFKLNPDELACKLHAILGTICNFYELIDQEFECQQSFQNNKDKLGYLLQIFLKCKNLLNSDAFSFETNNKFQICDYFAENKNIEIKNVGNKFQFVTCCDITLEPLEMHQINNKFYFKLSKSVSWSHNDNLQIQTSVFHGVPPYYNIDYILMFNYKDTEQKIPTGTVIGSLEVEGLEQGGLIFNKRPENEMYNKIYQEKSFQHEKSVGELNEVIVGTLENQRQLRNDQIDKLCPSLFQTRADKEIHITTLLNKAKIDVAQLPTNKNKKVPFLNFHQYRNLLNKILLAQNLMKNKHVFSPEAVADIQNSSQYILNIKQQVQNSPNGNHNGFLIIDNILYKESKCFNSTSFYRLAIPEYLASQVLFNLHHGKNLHLSTNQLIEIFNNSFYVKGSHTTCKKVVDSCATCVIQKASYNKKIKGVRRFNEDNSTPGAIYYCDVAYLPRDQYGYRYVVLLVERLSGHISAAPIKSLTASSVTQAVRQFFSTLPLCEKLGSDFGPEFAKSFTNELANLGILHIGSIPKRSQQQGTVERAVRSFKAQLGKLVADPNVGRKLWSKALPQVIHNLNLTHPYGLPLSRIQLLFSPYIYNNNGPIVNNSSGHDYGPALIKLQNDCYAKLNKKRIEKLSKQKIQSFKPRYKVGQFVFYNEESQNTEDQSKQLAVPKFKDTYKIIEIAKDGFEIRLLNLRNGAERTCSMEKITQLELTDLLQLNIDPKMAFSSLPEFRGRGLFVRGVTGNPGVNLAQDRDNEEPWDKEEPGGREEALADVVHGEGAETSRHQRDDSENEDNEKETINDYAYQAVKPPDLHAIIPEPRYSLRNRDVIIQSANHSTHCSLPRKSCLKSKSMHESQFKDLLLLGQSEISALKEGIKLSIIQGTNAGKLSQKVLNTNFNTGNLARYNETPDKFKVCTGQKVHFDKKIKNKDCNRFLCKINLINIFASTKFCCSLQELAFLRTDIY